MGACRKSGRPAAGADRRGSVRFALPPAGPPALGVWRLENQKLVHQARRLHAATYLQHGYLTARSVGPDGLLIHAIDPPEVVARSTYLGGLDDEGDVSACVRMIHPAGADIATLPTVGKLLASADAGDDATNELPFPPDALVFEVSGLAKSRRCDDRAVVTRLLLAVASEAHRRGEDYGLMALVSTTAKRLMAAYGEQAIRPLHCALGSVTIGGVGVRSAGVQLVPCYSETATFVGDCLAHCLTRPDDESSRLNWPLFEFTAAAMTGGSTAALHASR